jgi:hypothetical protein
MSEGIMGRIGGSDLSKMMLFMFLGLIIAILVLGFHRSPKAAPTANVGQGSLNRVATALSKPNANPNMLLIQNSGGY